MAYLGGTEMHTGFSWGSLKERDFLEDIGVDRWIVIKLDLPGIGREKRSAAVNSVVSENFKT